MGLAQTISQQQVVLACIVIILVTIMFNQVLVYYQYIIRLRHEARSSDEINIEAPQFPVGVIGLLLLGVGLGLAQIDEATLDLTAGPILICTGFLFSGYAVLRWLWSLVCECLDEDESGDDDKKC